MVQTWVVREFNGATFKIIDYFKTYEEARILLDQLNKKETYKLYDISLKEIE